MTNNDSDNNQLKTSNKASLPKSKQRWLFENVVSLGLALLLVFMIRSSIIEPFKIPSGSMIPTLFIGDHIFVNKFAYGLKVPFSDLFFDKSIQIIKRDPPNRGDIIVFMFPKDESIHYIKRVVGVPGDIIEIRNRMLYVNNQQINRVQLPDEKSSNIFKALDDPKYSSSSLELFSEHLGNTDHVIMHDRSSFLDENRGPIPVPPDSLFVMGDNRDFSNDSRFWGFVPMKNVKGKAIVIWLSLWISFSDSQFILRPDRIGTILR